MMKNDKEVIYKELEKIAKKYSDVNIDICFSGVNTYFKIKGNYIFYAISYVISLYNDNRLQKRSNSNNLLENCIFALYHELAHYLDYKKNPDKFISEVKKINLLAYNFDSEYHNKIYLEKKADRYARLKLREWKKCL